MWSIRCFIRDECLESSAGHTSSVTYNPPLITAEVLTELLMAPDVASQLRAGWGDLALAVPELGALAMEDPDGLHKDNVEHTILVVSKTPARLRVRLTALFHDVGKPETRVIAQNGEVSFHGHEAYGERVTPKILMRLGYDEDLSAQVGKLVGLSGNTKGSEIWTNAAVRRFVLEAGDLLEDLLDFINEDVTSKHEYNHQRVRDEVSNLRTRIAIVQAEAQAAKWRPVISGSDIMERLSLAPSPVIGRLLKRVSEAQRAAEAEGRVFTTDDAWDVLSFYDAGEE
jgi:poly(A) polymerase